MKVLSYLLRRMRDYGKDESGQTSIEYIMLLLVVVAIIFKFKGEVVNKITPLLDKVFGQKMDELLNSN